MVISLFDLDAFALDGTCSSQPYELA